MKHTQSAGGVVINSKGEILVASQHGTSWSLPKGHIEKGENPLKAAKREIFEETGVTNLEFVRDLGSYQRYMISLSGGDDKSELKTITMFLFKTTDMMLKPIDPKNPEAKWVPKGEVINLLTHPKDKEFFQSVIGEI